MSFKEIPNLKKTENGRGKLLNNVIKPAFNNGAKSFSALTAYFSTKSLESIGTSLDIFLSREGSLRIVIGDENRDRRILEAAKKTWLPEETIEDFKNALLEDVKLERDNDSRFPISIIAYLMLEKKLQIKVASYRGGERFHPKLYILEDQNQNKIISTGSGNMTSWGLEKNFELHDLYTSWDFGKEYFEIDDDPEYETHEEIFSKIWNNEDDNVEVKELDENYAEELLAALGNPTKEEILEYCIKFNESSGKTSSNEMLKKLLKSPIYHEFNLGTSALYPHQVGAVQKALKVWPIRTLFADEVGLGKTLELGSLIAYMNKNKLVKNTLVLTPASLTEQWQEEMKNHFNLDFARYDRDKESWVYLDDILPPIKEKKPIKYSDSFPPLAIISKSMAVKNREENMFVEADNYPDFLVVDEAHHARKYLDEYDGSPYKTNLRRMIEEVKENIPHIAFASATPMRKYIDEYYFLLDLLGIEPIISLSDYKNSLRIISDYIQNPHEEIELVDLSSIGSIIGNLLDRSRISFFSEVEELITFFEKIEENRGLLNKNEWLIENKDQLLKAIMYYHPARIFTVRNVQDNLNKFPETYQIPKRVLRPTQIKPVDIPEDVDDFFRLLMDYIDNYYQITELALDPAKSLPIALRKYSLQERFASSFWSAKKSIMNRKEKLENDLEDFKNKKITVETLYEPLGTEDEELDGDYETFTEEELAQMDYIKKINWEKVIETCEEEISSLNHRIDFAEMIIKNTPDGEDPDPKINELIRLVDEHFDSSEKPLLIFSKYTDTLDEVERAVIGYCEKNFPEVPGYASYRGDFRRVMYKGYSDHKKVSKSEITRGLKEGRIKIVFCSSAASEGLNLQAASYMINIDVPWVPSDLEQRIGRIARLGQKEPVVKIDNLWYPQSIESNMYRRLLSRQRDMSFAVGEYPELIAEGIKKSVDTDGGYEIDTTINEINRLKNTYEMKVLSQFWSIEVDSSTAKPWGNIFRSELKDLMSKLGLDIIDIETNSGDLDVLTFSLIEFSEIFSDINTEAINHNAKIYGLICDDLLWGFSYKEKESDKEFIIDPIKLPTILNSMFFGEKIKGIGKNIEVENLERLLNYYLEIKSPVIIPQHHLFITDIYMPKLPFNYNSEIERIELGEVTVADE